jgi:hypothetical protein
MYYFFARLGLKPAGTGNQWIKIQQQYRRQAKLESKKVGDRLKYS